MHTYRVPYHANCNIACMTLAWAMAATPACCYLGLGEGDDSSA